jgi:hypothetical protein
MVEMHEMDCPSCGTPNNPMGIVNNTEQYRCHNCGMVYYSPSECETEPIGTAGGTQTDEQPLAPDWEMTEPKPND